MVTAGKNLLFLLLGPAATGTNYRVKFTGFKTNLTPDNLAQLFGVDSRNCYVNFQNLRVGYVVKIKTIKYARQLMIEWHNQDIDGQKIKCQLELNLRPNRAPSPAASADGKPKHHRPQIPQRDARSLQSSQGTSDLDDTDNINLISFDNKEVDRDRRICGKPLKDITQTLSKTSLHRASSSETIATVTEIKCKFLFLTV